MANFLVGPQLLVPLAQKITDGVIKLCVSLSDNLKQQLRDDINSYLGNFVDKFSKIKTFLYSEVRRNFYDVYFPLSLNFENKTFLVPNNPDDLFIHNNYITILGYAGCGKTMILRHMFLAACNKSEKIPLVIELRKLKDYEGGFQDYIAEKVFKFKISQNEEIFNSMLKTGKFMFLLDGYDEIAFDHKDKITRELEELVDDYPANYYFLTSRPGSGAENLERFDNYRVCGLTKTQVLSFIDKQCISANEDEKELASKIKSVLSESRNNPYLKYMSSPLLLSMFILTYSEHPELPSRKSSFYYNVFDTLHSKHDAKSKVGGYQHEKKSKLSQNDIKRVLEAFCFITYMQSCYEFTDEYLHETLSKILALLKVKCNSEDLIYDLSVSISLLVQDGTSYVFPHRSLQEYFAASYIANVREGEKKTIYEKIMTTPDGFSITFWELCNELDQSCFTQYFLIPGVEGYIKQLSAINDKKLTFPQNVYFNYMKYEDAEIIKSTQGHIGILRCWNFYDCIISFLQVENILIKNMLTGIRKEEQNNNKLFSKNGTFCFSNTNKSPEALAFYERIEVFKYSEEFLEKLKECVVEQNALLADVQKNTFALIDLI